MVRWFIWEQNMIDSKLVQRRVQAVRRLMKKKNINCLLLTKPANVTYLTGFLGHDAWAVVTPTNTYLLTDSRYIEQAEKECVRCKPILRKETLHNTLAALVKELKTIRTVAVEETIGLKDFRQLEKMVKARLRIVSKIAEVGRSIKDAFEIASIKAAIQISAKALKETLKFLRPGVTENEAAGFLDYQFRRFGGKNGFETILAFGPNASRPHHQPGAAKLKKNDAVLVDFGGEFNHYCCDITRTFLVGRPNPFFEKVYKAVKEAQAAAITQIRPGTPNKLPEAVARETIRRYGLPPYQHGTGHGFGLEVHEEPFLSIKSKEKMEEGMVLTVEPGIYIPGKIGVRIEDDCLVTKTGCRILTGSVSKEYADICLGRM
jgi:Xaa-Pro aminopeptidase